MKRFLSLILALALLCATLCACDEKTVLDEPEDIIGEGNADTELELEPALNKKTLELTEGISFERSSDTALKIPTELLDFSLELFDKCADDENAVISPYSVLYALAMAQHGASGNTLEEFEKTIGTNRDVLEAYLNASLPSKDDALKTSNSIWIRNNFEKFVKAEFLSDMKKSFATEVFSAAFNDETLKDINKYISDKTNDLIQDALKEISADTVMFLINTVYFKAEWVSPFSGSNHELTFNNMDGSKGKTPYMYSDENKYISDDKAEGFIKEYKDCNYAFAAILPNKGVEIDDYVDSLTGKHISDMLSSPASVSMEVEMPKFETKFGAPLKEILSDMGIKDAFNPDAADFSDMANGVFISKVTHDAIIKVNEKGTEAAAATIVAFDTESGPDKRIVINRPFMYVIFDTQTYAPIFIGQITNM